MSAEYVLYIRQRRRKTMLKIEVSPFLFLVIRDVVKGFILIVILYIPFAKENLLKKKLSLRNKVNLIFFWILFAMVLVGMIEKVVCH